MINCIVLGEYKKLLFTSASITPLIDTEDALLVAHRVNSNYKNPPVNRQRADYPKKV